MTERPVTPPTPGPDPDRGGPRLKPVVDWGDCSPRVEEHLEIQQGALYRCAECGWIDWFEHSDAPAVIEILGDPEAYLTDDEIDKLDLFTSEMKRVGRLKDNPGAPDCLEAEWTRTLKKAATREGLLSSSGAGDGDAAAGRDDA